jgi:hypothetical protein
LAGRGSLITRFQGKRFLPLELKPRGFLFIRQEVTLFRDNVRTESAIYRFQLSENDDENDWVFRYEYDRVEGLTKPHAHFHINATDNVEGRDVSKLHFPTGRLSIEQIIAHLILEHGVEPLARTKEDALARLSESYRQFIARRTDLNTEPILFP